MNRNLVYFSVFLVIMGIGFGSYLISFFGLLLLIPALLSPSRIPPPRPSQQREAPRRIIPQIPPRPQASVPAQPTAPMASTASMAPIEYSSQPMQQQYSALFPMAMFPSLSQMGTTTAPASQPPSKPEPRDDLIEFGTILALLKLVFG